MSFYDEYCYLHVAEYVMNKPVIQSANHECAHADMTDPYIVKRMTTL